MNIFNLSRIITAHNRSVFDSNPSEQRVILDAIKKPTTLLERSYCQYLCQTYYMPKWVQVVLNVLSFLVIPFCLIALIFRPFHRGENSAETVIALDSKDRRLVPKELDGLYAPFSKFSLRVRDIGFLAQVWYVKPISFYFLLKILLKVGQYRYIIDSYDPQRIVVTSEYSFCSSILTHYCHLNDIEHINIMHGEKLYYIRDSFFKFDKCYVWDQHYIDLFTSLRADSEQFVISVPSSLSIDVNLWTRDQTFDYKYYLQNENRKEIEQIVQIMTFISNKGYSVKIRRHPIYTTLEMFTAICPREMMEDTSLVPIEESLVNTKNIISTFSTVLCQGVLLGKKIVVNDVVYPDIYSKLKELKHIVLYKEHTKLSDEINFLKHN